MPGVHSWASAEYGQASVRLQFIERAGPAAQQCSRLNGSGVTAVRWESNAPLRANQLRGELERLGPAYVKVAQAVSTRVDILPPAYLIEMERLQVRWHSSTAQHSP